MQKTAESSWALCLLGAGLMLMTRAVNADTIDTTGQEAWEQCGYCHEYDGNTRMPNYPRLAGQLPAYMKKQLEDFRAGRRRGQMTATAEMLSDQDIEDVVAYFSAQRPRSLDLPAQDGAARQTADTLYRQGDPSRGLIACAGCHGEQGHGQNSIPALAGQQPDYMKSQLQAFRSGQRSNDVTAQMSAIAARLSDQEMEYLTDYLARLKPVALTSYDSDSVSRLNRQSGR